MKESSKSKQSGTHGNERSSVMGVGLAGPGAGGNSLIADTRDGKIVRLKPLHYDWKYDKKQFDPWKVDARGKTLEPRMNTLPPAFGLAYKKRIYSPNRIKYPIKRVDWDPNGERNPQNRGKSRYVRISWDEATDIIAAEIRRMHKTYDPYAILVQFDGHGESKAIHKAHGNSGELLELMGGCTMQIRNPDSWEGWAWGARHVWGMPPVGIQSKCY